MKLFWWSLFLKSFNQEKLYHESGQRYTIFGCTFGVKKLKKKHISFCICWRWFPPAWMIAPLDLIRLRLTPFFPLAWYPIPPLVWYFKGSKTSKDFDDRRLSMIRQRNNIGGRYYYTRCSIWIEWILKSCTLLCFQAVTPSFLCWNTWAFRFLKFVFLIFHFMK